MLRRSHSAANAKQLALDVGKSRHTRPKLRGELIGIGEDGQSKIIGDLFQAKYGYPARPQQIQAVVHLINGRTTFLLAGTGFGKSRVPELLYLAYAQNYAPILLSINPLDALGDDQVSEKDSVKLNGVNLTGANCTQETCNAIIEGKYTFVYVSPEIALTSEIFDRLWTDSRFQSRLVLNVVDEAHMVYTWGLVESGVAKKLASWTRVHDGGAFRPSYGQLARRFLGSDKVPLLLMSATCTPQAIHAILVNLKLDTRDVRFVRAELVRPEIRLIRRTFKRPLQASLRSLFAHHTLVPTATIPPTLIYSGTQNATLDYLELINLARGQPAEAANGSSDFARRYHATTGDNAKLAAVEAYAACTLAVICCTLALGLGQNWHRVRRVVIVGRQDPCNFIQMSGRCGRDGRRGLGFLLVEHCRASGKNKIEDFDMPEVMSDDDRMDALAITLVCLRVALAVDLEHGYIPLDEDAWVVHNEEERQRKEKMAECDCSNCQPEEAEALWLAQAALTNAHFDTAFEMGEDELLELKDSLPDPPPRPVPNERLVPFPCGNDDPIVDCPVLGNLVTLLDQAFKELWYTHFTRPCHLIPDDYFGRDLAWDLAKNIDIFEEPEDMAIVLASESIRGQFDCLFAAFLLWKGNPGSVPKLEVAAERRLAASRGPPKPIQSVEGALITKTRTAAERIAGKAAKLLAKAQAAEAKEAEKVAAAAQLAKDKLEADMRRLALKEAAAVERVNKRERAKQDRAEAAAKKKASAAAKKDADRMDVAKPRAPVAQEAKRGADTATEGLASKKQAISQGPIGSHSPTMPPVAKPKQPYQKRAKRGADTSKDGSASKEEGTTQVSPSSQASKTTTVPKPRRPLCKRAKRGADTSAEGTGNKDWGTAQVFPNSQPPKTTTRQLPPTEIAKIDPRLYQHE